jgi:hypothetical protein
VLGAQESERVVGQVAVMPRDGCVAIVGRDGGAGRARLNGRVDVSTNSCGGGALDLAQPEAELVKKQWRSSRCSFVKATSSKRFACSLRSLQAVHMPAMASTVLQIMRSRPED